MSTKAGTIQGTPTGMSYGAWIAAILLAALIVVSLFAVNASRGTSAPARTGGGQTSTTFQGNDQLSGGRNVTGVTSTLPHGL